ncbi:hypothetical protein [Neptuniibacter sp. QD34_54]|uniref:hypothetical protein n=1 Tax=Neptuniibacter sp. QD34_54 TaxID=3398208 RepID=UPI0039F51F56
MQELQRDIQLSEREIARYMKWAQQLQQKHADDCDGPLDSISITFQLSVFGTEIVAHASGIPDNVPQITLRSI